MEHAGNFQLFQQRNEEHGCRISLMCIMKLCFSIMSPSPFFLPCRPGLFHSSWWVFIGGWGLRFPSKEGPALTGSSCSSLFPQRSRFFHLKGVLVDFHDGLFFSVHIFEHILATFEHILAICGVFDADCGNLHYFCSCFCCLMDWLNFSEQL